MSSRCLWGFRLQMFVCWKRSADPETWGGPWSCLMVAGHGDLPQGIRIPLSHTETSGLRLPSRDDEGSALLSRVQPPPHRAGAHPPGAPNTLAQRVCSLLDELTFLHHPSMQRETVSITPACREKPLPFLEGGSDAHSARSLKTSRCSQSGLSEGFSWQLGILMCGS